MSRIAEMSAWIGRMLMLAAAFCAGPGAARGQNWMPASGIPAAPVLGVTEQGGSLYAFTLDSVYRSGDSGATWVPTAVQPGKPMQLMALHGHRDHLYCGTMREGIYRTSDGGEQWESFNEGYPGSAVIQFLTLGDSMYVGTDANGVFVRDLSGLSTWTAYNDGLERFGVQTMATSGDLLLANIGMSTYVRPRGNSAWTEIVLDSAGGQLEVKSFLRLGDYLYAGIGTGILRGTPDAQGWEKAGIGLLPFRPVTHMAGHGDRLYAGVPLGLEHFICSTGDAGASWEVNAHEFAELIALSVLGDRMYASRADGLWYFDLGAPTSVLTPAGGRPASFELFQNYPNPFNGRTVVSSRYLVASHVKLAVYDLLGREVAVLVDEWRLPGTYHDRFSATGHAGAGRHSAPGVTASRADAGGLASGIYIYRLTAGQSSQTRTMLLLR